MALLAVIYGVNYDLVKSSFEKIKSQCLLRQSGSSVEFFQFIDESANLGFSDTNSNKNNAINISRIFAHALHAAINMSNQYGCDSIVLISSDTVTNNKRKLNIFFDPSLPEEKIYLPYDFDIDFGYEFDAIRGSRNLLQKLDGLFNFINEISLGANDYVDLLTIHGWPQTTKINILDKVKKMLMTSALFMLNMIHFRIDKLEALKRRLKRNIERFSFICEINNDYESSRSHKIYPLNRSYHINSLFKYYIYQMNLREFICFLSDDDFE